MNLKALFFSCITACAQSPLGQANIQSYPKLPLVVGGGDTFNLGEVSTEKMINVEVSLRNVAQAPIILLRESPRVASAYLMPTDSDEIQPGAWKTVQIQVDPKALDGVLQLAVRTTAGPLVMKIHGHCVDTVRAALTPGTLEGKAMPVEFRLRDGIGKVTRWWLDPPAPLVVAPVSSDGTRWVGSVTFQAGAIEPSHGFARLFVETQSGSVGFTTIAWQAH